MRWLISYANRRLPQKSSFLISAPRSTRAFETFDFLAYVGFGHLRPEDRHQLVTAHDALHLLRTLASGERPLSGQVGEGGECIAGGELAEVLSRHQAPGARHQPDPASRI